MNVKLWLRWLKNVLAPTPVRISVPRRGLRVEGLNDRINPCGMAGTDLGMFAFDGASAFAARAFDEFAARGAFRYDFGFGFGFGGMNFGGFERPELPVQETTTEAASFQVRLVSEAYAGEETKLLVTALDEANQPIHNYTGTVHLEASDPTAEVPEDYTFTRADRGSHVFEVIAGETGELTVTVTQVEATTDPEPVVEEPVVEEPVAEEPVVDTVPAGMDLILGEDLAATVSILHDGQDHSGDVTDEPIVDDVVDQVPVPVVDEPIVDDVIDEEPVVDEPILDDVTGEPIVDDVIDQEPILDDEPAVDDPTTPEVEVPVDEVPTGETPVEETPTDPTGEIPVDETPIDEVPVDETPIDEVPIDEVPVDETPTDPIDETPVDDVPTDPVDETPVDPLPPVDETPVDPLPPVDETPVDPPVVEPPIPETPAEPVDVTGVITFDVSEAPLATHFAVRALPGATAGNPTRFAVVPLDESNEPVTNYTGTVTFSSSDPDAVLPEAYTFTEADQGIHVFAAEFQEVGGHSLSVTADDGTTTGDVKVTVSEPAGKGELFSRFFGFRTRGDFRR